LTANHLVFLRGRAMIAKQLNFLAPGFDAASGLAVDTASSK
jgi:hypothetical protein